MSRGLVCSWLSTFALMSKQSSLPSYIVSSEGSSIAISYSCPCWFLLFLLANSSRIAKSRSESSTRTFATRGLSVLGSDFDLLNESS